MPNHQQELLPLYRATASLKARYHFEIEGEIVKKYVPASKIHAQLFQAEAGYRQEYQALYNSDSAKKGLKSANIATAEIGFLYSKESLEEGPITSLDYDHIAVRVPASDSYTFQVSNFFYTKDNYTNMECTANNKSLRNHIFNNHIKQRIDLFRQFDFFTQSTTALTSSAHFASVEAKANFHENFHHSEQALMEFLSSQKGYKFIADEAQKLHAKTIAGIVLDIYSTRYLCDNCNVNLIGFQNTQEAGAINNITTTLSKPNYRIDTLPAGLLWSTRVSGSDLAKGSQGGTTRLASDTQKVHRITQHDSHLILQADSKKLDLERIAQQRGYTRKSFLGDYFTSRNIKKDKMETALADRELIL